MRLEKGTYDGSATYHSGSIEIGDYTITDWNKRGWEILPLIKVMNILVTLVLVT